MADVLPDHMRFERFRGTRLVLGVTGSVAAFRALDLLRGLRELGVDVGVTLTTCAREFVTPLSFQALGADPVLAEQYPSTGRGVGDALEEPFAHLAPSRAADALCVAPASADFIARLAQGRADDLLACQALAFSGPANGKSRPLVVAPAMNPAMWAAPATQANWMTLMDRGVIGVGPCAGRVACGDAGAGRMSDVAVILAACAKALSPKDMAGKKVLVNLGPTWERWDAVRFLSNPSTGKMGAAVAMAAWLRGAEVTAVCGPTELDFPVSDGLLTRVDVVSARQMREACLTAWETADLACMTAAVSDFAPVPWQDGETKYKKPLGALRESYVPPDIKLALNPDILAEMGARKRPGQRLAGFAAETGNLEAAARAKLEAKNLDMIVANLVNMPGHGFGGSTNAALVLGADDRIESWPVLPKAEMAWRIWDLVSEL